VREEVAAKGGGERIGVRRRRRRRRKIKAGAR
jgi:hypothetical protein